MDEKPEIPLVAKTNRIRLTIESENVKKLDSAAKRFIARAQDKKMQVKGPVPLPTKVLRITTRKTPCGEGSKTWDRFQLRIHKRIIDVLGDDEAAQQMTRIILEPGVYCNVKIGRS